MHRRATLLSSALLLHAQAIGAAPALSVDPVNPHYLDFRGRVTVLIGASEHYGAVINGDFNYIRYLDALEAEGLNATRIFTGQYRERAGPFGRSSDIEIVENTLAPNANVFLPPWQRSNIPGALDGKAKFDLTKWNGAYFERLESFVKAAGDRGIVVEVSLFSPYYADLVGDWFWNISPLNSKNNVNGIGAVAADEVLSLKDARLLAVEDALVQRIVESLTEFDNVYYEICNEPSHDHVSHDWQEHIAHTISRVESRLPKKHLIAEEFVSATVRDSHSDLSTMNVFRRTRETSLAALHNALDADISRDYEAGIPLGQNEFVGGGFSGGQATNAIIRANAWRLILNGAAFDLETDYSFVRQHEDGTFPVPEGGAGGGNSELRAQLAVLLRFANGLPLRKMRPSRSVTAVAGLPTVAISALEWKGNAYAIYLDRGGHGTDAVRRQGVDPTQGTTELAIHLPPGRYVATWLNPREGSIVREEVLDGALRPVTLKSPLYSEDLALRIGRAGSPRPSD